MKAIVTTGTGGYEKLEFRDVPTPVPDPDEVLIQVLAAGVNNTEINLRVGWYASKVTASTESTVIGRKIGDDQNVKSGWETRNPFPLIQGIDCCGRIVDVGEGVDKTRIGSRVLVRSCMDAQASNSKKNVWLGTDINGAFAQYVKVPAGEAFKIDCDWSDAELGSIPCAYGTAENMLHLTGVTDDHVLITGASGGVGSAAVKLAKRRGATVTAIAGKEKMAQVLAIGADRVIPRGSNVVDILGEESVDVVVDIVGGPEFGRLIQILKRGGKCVISGAIAGPIVQIDLRPVYLKDITLIGATAWGAPVFPNLIGYIERGEIQPTVARAFPLENIAEAQQEFLKKNFVGKFVLIPPQD